MMAWGVPMQMWICCLGKACVCFFMVGGYARLKFRRVVGLGLCNDGGGHHRHHLSFFINTLKPGRNGGHFVEGIFNFMSLHENVFLSKFHRFNMLPRVQLTNTHHWFR